MRKYFFLPAFFLLFHLVSGAQALKVRRLLCEDVREPLGMDILTPHLSWELRSELRSVIQTAYRVIVASSPENAARGVGDLWDSQKKTSQNSVRVPYGGAALHSRQECYWKVMVWTADGKVSAWSPVAHWSMGLLTTPDWSARWIGYDGVFSSAERPDDRFTRVAARYLRKEFVAAGKIKKAMAYISGVGLYELYLNGVRVGDQVLAPGPTDYAKRVFYNTYDVSSLLRSGPNAIGVILGNGRFVAIRQHLEDTTNNCVNYGFPKLLMQLEISFADGRRLHIGTDGSWMISGDGPILANNEYDGEEYDATREFGAWTQPGFKIDRGSGARWQPVQIVAPAAPVVQSQLNPPIRIMQTLQPRSFTQPKRGVYIFDMAQNMVGWVRLKVRGPKGQVVKLRFAERLREDGTLYTENLGDARVTDIYTLKGEGLETWRPRFTYHGFRYVELSGFPGVPTLETIRGEVVHDDLEITGHIKTSNEVLNKIYHNMYWGIRSNYRGIPTDCPQRDERMGWLGDRAAVGTGESYLFSTHLLYSKWMQDIEDAQNDAGSIPDVAPAYWRMYTDNTTWPSAYVYNIRMIYQQYGDREPILHHYESIKKWLAYMKERYMKDTLITANSYGDWCVPPETLTMIFSNDSTRKTPGDYLSTVFYYDLVNIMNGFAAMQDKKEDIAYFAEEARNVRDAVNHQFLNPGKDYYANNTTTANVLALAFGIVPEERRAAVFAHVVDKTMNEGGGHITTGLVGIQQLMRCFMNNGRPDIAYRLATTTSYPGWGYMLTQGATTIWELWNGNTADPAMNSANHVMMIGDLLTWYYESLAGIKASAPAFSEILMRPIPPAADDLHFVKASYHSPYGLIVSNWQKEKGVFDWTLEVPANSHATVYLPAKQEDAVKEGERQLLDRKTHTVKTGERDIKMIGREDGCLVLRIGSGRYHFIVEGAAVR